MKMISHQAAGVDLPFGLEAGFGEGLQKSSAVSVVPKIGSRQSRRFITW
jgi:hypothetical protein